MKKLILIFTLLFTLCTTLAFADKTRFYENGSVIDTMYVDSKEGLRVRDAPSLKSNRLCGLPHRLPVKVIAIGNLAFNIEVCVIVSCMDTRVGSATSRDTDFLS